MAEQELRMQVEALADGGVKVSFEGRLSIRDVPAARETLMDAFSRAGQVTLDLGGVSEGDLAGLQLLWSALHTARDRGASLTFARRSEALCGRAAIYGLGAVAPVEMGMSPEGGQ